MGCIQFYILGGTAIFISIMVSGSIYLTTKRRQIIAYHTQQVVPVAQEGIEKMTPTIGKAWSSIAKEISKGIKEGLKDNEKK